MEYTYENYCDDLDLVEKSLLTEGLLDNLKGIPAKLKDFILPVVKNFPDISIKDAIKAFKQSKVFDMLKYFGFSLKKIALAINKGLKLIDDGLLKAISELHKTKVFKKVRAGTMKIDEVINKYPVLNRITGIGVAGILVMIWLNMSFSGNFSHDMDLTGVFHALKGDFSIEDLFGSEIGNKMLILLGVGLATGGTVSFPWLARTGTNLSIAIAYSAFKVLQGGWAGREFLDSIKFGLLKKTIKEDSKFLEFLHNDKYIEKVI